MTKTQRKTRISGMVSTEKQQLKISSACKVYNPTVQRRMPSIQNHSSNYLLTLYADMSYFYSPSNTKRTKTCSFHFPSANVLFCIKVDIRASCLPDRRFPQLIFKVYNRERAGEKLSWRHRTINYIVMELQRHKWMTGPEKTWFLWCQDYTRRHFCLSPLHKARCQ